jgi:UDP-glucose:(heptosyl)LPS alpha-1,3-glucosyltransferase
MPTTHGRSPRIALVIDRFDGNRGGAALWTRGFAAWLAARECDVHVLARCIGPVEARLPITFHTVSVGRSPLAFAATVSQRLAALAPLISHDMGGASGCDVFQPHFGSGLACWRGSVASYPRWLRPAKRLCGMSPRYRRLRRLCAAQFRGGGSLFIAVSLKAASEMEALHGVPKERIRVVYNGVELSRFEPLAQRSARRALRQHYGIRDDEVVVIAAAHHLRLKGVPALIRAVEQLRRAGEPVRLLLCGSGRADAADAAPKSILRCGRVDDVAPYYAAADVCVHPTYYDACSLVTLEALAAGLPVVTTRANGASELLTPGVNGVVLDGPPSGPSVASALRPLIRDAALRRQLGAAGRRLVWSHSVERNYYEIALAYADALAMRSIDAAPLEPLLASAERPRHTHAATRRLAFGLPAPTPLMAA